LKKPLLIFAHVKPYGVHSSKTLQKGNVTASENSGVAEFRITGGIGYSETCNAEYFKSLVDGFLGKGIKNASVYISTPGGNVFQTNDIINELLRFESVKLIGGAMIASAGTFFAAKFHTSIKSNTRFMIHKPAMPTGGNEDQIESDLKLLKDVTTEYREAYAKKTGKTTDEIEAMWAKGDVWLTAKQALEQKFVDAIIDQEEKITVEDAAMIEACGCPDKPKITVNSKMEKEELISILGLPADATDEQIKTALMQMKEKADKAETPPSGKTEEEKKADSLVDKAIADKKITADQKANFVKMAIADYESASSFISNLKPVAKLSEEIDHNKDKAIPEARKTWSLDDYLDKDPDAYEKLKETNPVEAKRLEDEYFKQSNTSKK
jgi:ATP-dependent Clp protease, protease subunit